MNSEEKEEILKNINAALKSRKLYPAGHPSMAAPVKKTYGLITDALRKQNNFAIGLINEALVFEDALVMDSEKLCPEIIRYLADKNVNAVIFERGTTEKELSSIFEILSGPTIRGSELQKELHANGVTHVTLKSVQMGKRNMLEIYNGAVDIVKNVMGEVRMGKIPKSEPVYAIVDELTESVLSDPNAVLGLTMIKNYDNYLYNHCVNVSIMALALGKALNLDKFELHAVGVAALLHDIGKTGVAENIIRKPGGLSTEEWEKIKEHPLLGSNIVKRMEKMVELVGRLVYEHHIRYDRSGYPQTSETVHPFSQIITICDAYDALTTLRVYQMPHNPVEAIKLMTNLSGRHFNPDTLKKFINMIGLYPVGTMVRLTTNEIGIVMKVKPDAPDCPQLKIVYDSDGKTLDKSYEIELGTDEWKDTKIAATVNPATVNIDLGAFFEKEAV